MTKRETIISICNHFKDSDVNMEHSITVSFFIKLLLNLLLFRMTLYLKHLSTPQVHVPHLNSVILEHFE
jgi:hypothetical protein